MHLHTPLLLALTSLLISPTTLSQTIPTSLSPLAQQLGLATTYTFPFPSSLSTGSAITDVISSWGNEKGSITGGSSDINFVQDPFNTSESTVMRILYAAGSWAPSKAGGASGAEFYAAPDAMKGNGSIGYKTALVSYDVGFPQGFDFVKAGKLPGIYGGDVGGCSGGKKADGTNCFSVRMMWRQTGIGEAYAYIPASDDFCTKNLGVVMCNQEYGVSIGRGSFSFKTGGWTHVDLYVQLNEADTTGLVAVWVDGRQMFNLTGLTYHTTDMVQIEDFFFSTFFGGSSKDYATPTDQYSYFKNIQLSVGQPQTLSGARSIYDGREWATAVLLSAIAVMLWL